MTTIFVGNLDAYKQAAAEFISRQKNKNAPHPAEDGRVKGDMFLITEYIVPPDGMESVFDYPRVDGECVVGMLVVENPGKSYSAKKSFTTNIYMAPEYVGEVSMAIAIKDFLYYVIVNHIAYRGLWFVQANNDSDYGGSLCEALDSTELATKYTDEHSGKSGYSVDLRIGHYMWSRTCKENQEEE